MKVGDTISVDIFALARRLMLLVLPRVRDSLV